MIETVTLWRSIGARELELVRESGMRSAEELDEINAAIVDAVGVVAEYR